MNRTQYKHNHEYDKWMVLFIPEFDDINMLNKSSRLWGLVPSHLGIVTDKCIAHIKELWLHLRSIRQMYGKKNSLKF